MEKRPKRVVKLRGDGTGDLNSEASRYSKAKQRRSDGIEGQGGEKLTLSIKDVKVCSILAQFVYYFFLTQSINQSKIIYCSISKQFTVYSSNTLRIIHNNRKTDSL